MIADTMCMGIALAARSVAERPTVAADTQVAADAQAAADMVVAAAVTAAVEESVKARSTFINQHSSIYIYEISKPVSTFFKTIEPRFLCWCLRDYAGDCAMANAGAGFEGVALASTG
jgi:hypothetical protein